MKCGSRGRAGCFFEERPCPSAEHVPTLVKYRRRLTEEGIIRSQRPEHGETTMKVLTVSEAQQRLPELLEAARHGQTVEIIQRDQRFRLLALPPLSPRPRPPVTGIPKAGRYAGRLIVPADFDEPLDELREYME
jgi:antitoxin (DNA-binding transcriptional repressor) of toxin-antitoxin stability system